MSHSEKPHVAVVRVHNEDELYRHVARAFDILKPTLPKSAKVIIKPNLCALNGPESGATTDVRVVDAMIRVLNENYNIDKIAVVESDSWNRLAVEAFQRLRYTDLPKTHRNVELVGLSTKKTMKVRLPHPTYFRFLRLPEIFFEYNYFITVPKLKAPFPIWISCALKNQFGCLPLRFKGKYHPYLDDIIGNLNLLLRPDLCVVDGIVGYDGQPRPVGLLIASADPVATDTTAAELIGLSPRRIHYLVKCKELGIGKMDGINVTVDGCETRDLRSVQMQFKHSSVLLVSLADFGYWLGRMADRTSRLGTSIVVWIGLLPGILRHSKREIVQMLLSPRYWKILVSLLRSARAGSEP
jgi:uncharacterized protein (DUF362 family)